ncbi:MAG: hypothetical protein ACOX52_06605 [Verrucomicrobiota bacterium]
MLRQVLNDLVGDAARVPPDAQRIELDRPVEPPVGGYDGWR